MQERIALGFGDNVDYELAWNTRVIEGMVTAYGVRADELSVDRPVETERDLLISILSFLKAGVGGERTVASSDILERFSQRFAKRVTLGGTGVRAAIAMRTLGVTSALHLVTVNDHVRRLVPRDSPFVCSNPGDSLYPHVIVQFGQGTVVQTGGTEIRADHANRIIYHRDDDNIAMKLNEDFAELITGARAFLISGFNAMQSKTLLEARLEALARIMNSLPKGALIFYEDAGYYEPTFRHLIHRFLAGTEHVVSLNEDELGEYLGKRVDVKDVHQTAEALERLQSQISATVIVVHTRYWALAYGEEAARFSAALQGGLTVATTRFCYGDAFTAADYRRVKGLPGADTGVSFARAINRWLGRKVCCLPAAHVNPAKATTVGLGDAFVGGFLAAFAGDVKDS